MAQNSLRLVEDKAVDKSKALDAALSQIERAFGKGSIMRLGANEQVVEIETVPTGSLGLDIALHRVAQRVESAAADILAHPARVRRAGHEDRADLAAPVDMSAADGK